MPVAMPHLPPVLQIPWRAKELEEGINDIKGWLSKLWSCWLVFDEEALSFPWLSQAPL